MISTKICRVCPLPAKNKKSHCEGHNRCKDNIEKTAKYGSNEDKPTQEHLAFLGPFKFIDTVFVYHWLMFNARNLGLIPVLSNVLCWFMNRRMHIA